MRAFPTAILLLAIGCNSRSAGPPHVVDASQTQATALSWKATLARVHDEDYENALSSVSWAVAHAGSSDDSRVLLELLSKLAEAFENGQPELLAPIGGLEGVQKRLLALLGSSDDTVRGGAALILGVLGDRSVIPAIAERLGEKPRRSTGVLELPPVAKGSFAMALGMLGDRDSIPQLIGLLQQGNEIERQGAALGLGFLKDRTHAKLLVEKLLQPDLDVDKRSLLSALAMMDATDFVDQIALACSDRICGPEAEGALFRTLVALRATSQAGTIAKHLNDRSVFARGGAAKALAVLGAKEYGRDITRLLSDKDWLVQNDAALALGVLADASFAKPVARLLRAKQESTRYYAAFALVMMNERAQAPAAIAIIDAYHAKGYYFNESDLPVSRKEFALLKSRFDRKLAALR